MAIKNYASALGQIARESAVGSVKGFARGIKGAAMAEMPGIAAAYGLSRELKERAGKLNAKLKQEKVPSDKAGADSSSIDPVVKEQRANNVISIEMVRQLRAINKAVSAQTSLLNTQAANDRQKALFDEEVEREKAQRDSALLDAIKNLKGGGGQGGGQGGGGGPGAGGGGGGFLDNLLGSLASSGIGRALGIGAGAGAGFYGAKKIAGKFFGKSAASAAAGAAARGAAGVGAAAANDAVFKQTLKSRIGKMIAGRLGAAGAAQLIPGAGQLIGLGLLGWTAYDVYQLLFGDNSTVIGGEGKGKGLFASQGGQGGPYAVDSPRLRTGATPRNPSEEVSQSTGITKDYSDKLIKAESNGRNIANQSGPGGKATTSAFGIAQFTKPTFDGLMKRARPGSPMYEYENPSTTPPMQKGRKTFEQFKQDTTFQKICLNELTRQNVAVLKSQGVAVNDATAYLAHFLGPAGAVKVMGSPDSAKLTDVLSKGTIDSNPSLFGPKGSLKTVGDLKAWAAKKMGMTAAQASQKNAGGGRGFVNPPMALDKNQPAYQYATKDAGGGRGFINPPNVVPTEGGGAGGGAGGPPPGTTVNPETGDFYTPISTVNLATGEREIPVVKKVGSGTQGEAQPIPVVDKAGNQELKKIRQATARSGQIDTDNNRLLRTQTRALTARATRRVETPEQKIIREANERFLKSFQNTTANLLSKEIYKAVTVGFYGKQGSNRLVSKQQASAQMFRGQELAKALNLQKGTEKVLTSLFGKDIGKAYSPIIAQLGTSYLEVGARMAGRGLFSGAGFSDKDADALSGQIIGNFARGNKQAATEQLLYGMTGIASGPETIFFKYGFNSSQQASNFLGQAGAAYATSPIADMLGGPQPTYRDPRTGSMYGVGGSQVGYGQYPTMNPGGVGGTAINAANYNINNLKNQQMTVAQKAATAESLVIGGRKSDEVAAALGGIEKNTLDAVKNANDERKLAEDRYLKSQADFRAAKKEDEDFYAKQAEANSAKEALDGVMREQDIRRNQLLEEIAKKPTATGGGSTAGGTFMSSLGNMAFDLGVSMIANKLTSGIKNPYLKAFGNFAISSAANSFIKPEIFKMFGSSAAGSAAGGASAAGSAAGAVGGAAGAAGTMGFGQALGAAGGFAGFKDALAGSLGMAGTGMTLSGYAANVAANMGYTGVSNFFAGMNATSSAGLTTAGAAGYAVSEALPYVGAIMRLISGDVKGAALSAAGAFIGNLILPGIGGVIGGFLGGLFGGGGSSPQYKTLLRVVRVQNNNDPSVRATTSSANGPPKEFGDFADVLLTGLFNSAKAYERISGITAPFVYIGVYVHQGEGVKIFFYYPGEPTDKGSSKVYDAGALKDFSVNKALSGAADYMKNLFADGKDAAAIDKLAAATKFIHSKSVTTLTKGLLSEFKARGRYELPALVGEGMWHKNAEMSNLIEKYTATLNEKPPTGGAGYDSDGNMTESPRMVWSFKEKKYVEAPSTSRVIDLLDEYGNKTGQQQTIKSYDDTVIGIDENGNPIFNYDAQGNKVSQDRISISDLQKHVSVNYPNVTTVTPTTVGSGTSTSVTPTPDRATPVARPGKSKEEPVVNNVVTNSTKTDNSTNVVNVNQVSASADPWRMNAVNTGMPLFA